MQKLRIKKLKELINDLPDDMQVIIGAEGQVVEVTDKDCSIDYAYSYVNPNEHEKCFCIDAE